MKVADMEPLTRSWILRLYLIEELHHGNVASGGRVGDERRRNWKAGGHCAVAERAGASGGAGTDAAGVL
jgi:hypothetical protein